MGYNDQVPWERALARARFLTPRERDQFAEACDGAETLAQPGPPWVCLSNGQLRDDQLAKAILGAAKNQQRLAQDAAGHIHMLQPPPAPPKASLVERLATSLDALIAHARLRARLTVAVIAACAIVSYCSYPWTQAQCLNTAASHPTPLGVATAIDVCEKQFKE